MVAAGAPKREVVAGLAAVAAPPKRVGVAAEVVPAGAPKREAVAGALAAAAAGAAPNKPPPAGAAAAVVVVAVPPKSEGAGELAPGAPKTDGVVVVVPAAGVPKAVAPLLPPKLNAIVAADAARLLY